MSYSNYVFFYFVESENYLNLHMFKLDAELGAKEVEASDLPSMVGTISCWCL